MSVLRMFLILWRIQWQRVVHRLVGWTGAGGALGGLLLLMTIGAGLHLVLASSLDRLFDPERAAAGFDLLRYTRYEDIPDQSARLILFFVQGTWLSALFLKWGQWQSLQRDAEWEWFAERPWPPWILFIQRCLVESFWPQVVSLFPGLLFVLIALRRGLSWPMALATSCCLAVFFQALAAAPRLTVDLWLRQRWGAHATRSFRGIAGLLGAGLLLISLQALTLDSRWIMTAIEKHGQVLDASPAGLALSSLIMNDSGRILRSLAILCVLVLGTHGLCYALAAILLRQPLASFQGWMASRSDGKPRSGPLMLRLWTLLHPLTRRDILCLTRDRHLILQLILAPLILIILPQSPRPADASWIWALSFGTGFLFLWSSIFHILPMEGRSLWLLFTFPLSPVEYIWRRLRPLLALAGLYSALVLGLMAFRSEGPLALWRLPYLVASLVGFAWFLTALAVGARAFLQYALLVPAAGYAWLLARGSPLENVCGLLCLGLVSVGASLGLKERLQRLVEGPPAPKKNVARVRLRLYLLKFMTR